MGYYTQFKVDFKLVGEQDPHVPFFYSGSSASLVFEFNRLIGEDLFDQNGWSKDSYKWYSWETDVLEASRRMPGVLITLTGSGEETGDLWRAYFLDGRVQSVRPRLEFPPFDPGKLRSHPHLSSRNEVRVWD